jgi:2',3'-cyclic-nucleotide 2'-phosphodiesterase (5'-nucleotidase family)
MFKVSKALWRAALVVAVPVLAAVILLLAGAQNMTGAGNTGEELFFTILHTNDEHSSIIPHSPAVDYHPELVNPAAGGFARLATAINQIRDKKTAAGEPVLLLNGGDFIGGSPFSWLIPRGMAPELTLMQLIGYDAVIIGNHEYDYGAGILAAYLQAAGYPEAHQRTVVLAANTVAPADHPLAALGLYRATHLLELENGLKVGLFGLIGKDAISVAADPTPVTFTDQHETARAAVQKLQTQGADVIIAITHAGVELAEDQTLAREVPGIHVIVGGHCHTAIDNPIIENGVIIVQAGDLLHYLGVLELAYNPNTGTVRIRNTESAQEYLIPIDSRFAPDPLIQSEIERFTGALNSLIVQQTGGRFHHILDTVAYSDFPLPDKPPLQETPFGNFVADAMRLVTAQKTGRRVDVALQANGVIRGSVTPGTMAHSRGKVSFYDLAELVGLGIGPDGYAGYPIVSVYLTGEEVRRALEVAVLLREMMGNTYFLQFSGLRYHYNPGNAILLTVPGINQPIPSALVGGGAVTRAELYTGEGRQGPDDAGYVPLERGDERLYHVVTDSYILSFLPRIGKMLPMLGLEIKDRDGNPVPPERFGELIVKVDGRELKVWQTVVEYAASQPRNAAGIPVIDPYYAATAGRINEVWSFPLVVWPLLILAALAAGLFFLIRWPIRRLRRKRALLGRKA